MSIKWNTVSDNALYLNLQPSLKDDDDESAEEDFSDDDFEGARGTHYEDPDMEDEADFAAQEAAEELKRQRIEGEW